MNPFFVDWGVDDLEDLADIWLNSPDRNGVTRAQNRIDDLLETNPLGVGEHVGEGLRKIHYPPLLVYYSVDTANRKVEVEGVAYQA
jgi:hypothetical protein